MLRSADRKHICQTFSTAPNGAEIQRYDFRIMKNKLQQLEQILATDGLQSALEFLNQQVTHRFTAVYRLDKTDLEIVELIDKISDPSTAPLSRVPFSQSFCELVVQDGSLATTNSALDKKFDGRTYQGIIASYVGLPLLRPTGELFGSLCHYDYKEQPISDDEFSFLQQAAVLLARSL